MAYDLLVANLENNGLNVEEIKSAIKNHHIETPSWGYANSGTRFKAYPWCGAARTTREKIDDAAMVHKMTGITPTIALHIPWDAPEDGDYEAILQYAEAQRIRIGAINPNVFQDDNYRLGSLSHPNSAVRQKALEHIVECCEIMTRTHSDILSLWLADGTNYPGQDNLRSRKHRLEEGLATIYKHLPTDSRMLLEYKFFEPAFYSTDLPDWGAAYSTCIKLGEKAQVLVDLGHHAPGVNIEQIVAFLIDEGRLGGFHFNNRKYADDDLIVGSINPYELFLIYNELNSVLNGTRHSKNSSPSCIAYMIDQCHNIEGKLAPMIQSVLNCQEAFAKSLLVDRTALQAAQCAGEVLGAHNLLNNAYRTDVRPLLAGVREEMGVPADPIAAYKASGYEASICARRGLAAAHGGFQ